MFLVFGVLKTKYLAFRTLDTHMKVPCLVMFWEEQLHPKTWNSKLNMLESDQQCLAALFSKFAHLAE